MMHYKISKSILLQLTCFLLVFNLSVFGQNYWNLPVNISDQNTKVEFDLDSTWHKFTGTTSNLSGEIKLSNPNDFKTVVAHVELPVAKFDTDSQGRDEEMREVMAEPKYKNVIFNLQRIENICDPQTITNQTPCSAKAIGDLQIRKTKKAVSIPITIKKEGKNFKISGQTTINWSEYGVEDPSILIATLYKEMIIRIELTL